MAIVLFILIAGLWAAFLLPSFFDHRSQTPRSTTRDFARTKQLLAAVSASDPPRSPLRPGRVLLRGSGRPSPSMSRSLATSPCCSTSSASGSCRVRRSSRSDRVSHSHRLRRSRSLLNSLRLTSTSTPPCGSSPVERGRTARSQRSRIRGACRTRRKVRRPRTNAAGVAADHQTLGERDSVTVLGCPRDKSCRSCRARPSTCPTCR